MRASPADFTCSLDFDFKAQKGRSPCILLYFTSFNNLGNSSPAKLAFVIVIIIVRLLCFIAEANHNSRPRLFTRISFMGCGVNKALIVVTIGPPRPAKTIVSPSRRVPFKSTTSIVVPKPSMFFTSITVHSRSYSNEAPVEQEDIPMTKYKN